MPDYKKRKSNKVNVQGIMSSESFRENVQQAWSHKAAGYLKRQKARKADERLASKRYSEIADKENKKAKLKDVDAPKTLHEKSNDTVKKAIRYVKAHRSSRDKRSVRHITPKYLLWLLGVVCLALIVLSASNENIRKPFNSVASAIITPIQRGVNAVGLWLSDKLEAQRTLNELEEENSELLNEVASLNAQITILKQQEQELDRLRNLLELKDTYSNYETTAAHIIAKSSGKWYSTFTIDKGTADGVEKNMNIIADGGLVGLVIDVGENFSTVRSIIDDESSVSAQFESNSELCVINGSLSLMEENLIEFTNVSGDVLISENDAVVTSHVSSKYVPGLLIGYVVDYEQDSNSLTQSGHIKPIVDFASLEEVLIITTVKETSD